MTAITKDRLKEAVHDLTILTDEGMHPTPALVKVAQDLNLTADQTRLVGRAFNTAHTATTREQGKNILDKLASTPIADCEGAVAQLSQVKEASPVADVYLKDRSLDELRGLSGKVAQDLSLQEYVKTASKKDTWQPGHRHRHYCEKYGCDGSDCDCDYCCQLRKDRSKTAAQLLSDLDYLEGQLGKLAGQAENLKDDLDGALRVLQKQASKLTDSERLALKLAAGQVCSPAVLEAVHAALPVSGTGRNIKVAAVQPPLRELIQDIDHRAGQLSQTIATLNQVAACRNKAAELLQKKTADSSSPNKSPLDFESALSPITELFSPKSDLARVTHLDRMLGSSAPSDQLDLQSRFVRHGINTPDHKRKLDSIRMQSAVNDMLSNDDIISQYDPDEVYRVYNELIQTAPTAMERPMIARTFMRETLAKGGLLGSYDLNPLMSYDKDIAAHRLNELRSFELAGAPNASSDRKANIVKNLPRA